MRLFTADGNPMSVAGLADLTITNNNNTNLVEIKTRVIVTTNPAYQWENQGHSSCFPLSSDTPSDKKNPTHPALISLHDMVRLNIIHESFPVTALHTTSSIEHFRSSVIKSNPNFCQRLNHVPSNVWRGSPYSLIAGSCTVRCISRPTIPSLFHGGS